MRIRSLFVALGLAGSFLLTSLSAPAEDPKKEEPKKEEPKSELPPDVLPANFRMFLVSDKRFEPLKDADGKPLKGPDGKDVPSPKNREGKNHCLVCEYGLNPVVAVFVRADADKVGPDDGVGKLIKRIDGFIPKHRADKMAAFVSFLRLDFKDDKGVPAKEGTKIVIVKTKNSEGAETEEKVEQDLDYPDDEFRADFVKKIGDLAKGLNTPNVPIGLAPEKSKVITAWKIKDTDEVTVILYYRMRIIGKPWAFAKVADLTDEKITEILKATEDTITKQK